MTNDGIPHRLDIICAASNLVEERFDLVLVDPFSFFLAPVPTLSVPMVKQDALYGSIRDAE